MAESVADRADAGLLEDWPRLFRAMVRSRRFDELALALQRQGAIDTFGESRGQEGVQAGVVADLVAGDMVFPSYRQPGVGLERGVTAAELLSFQAGLDNCPWDWRAVGYAPYCIPVGSQLAHATGWAWAERLRGSESATVVFFGEGAASQGEVHEAMNYAGVFGAPVVFVLENNGWAISLPASEQTRAEALHLRAAGYGIAGEQVDGNDVVAARAAMRTALARARAGEGPTLIEAITYRMGGHTTSDDPSRYRSDGDRETWAERDPIERLRGRLAAAGLADDDAEQRIRAEVEAELERSIDGFLESRGLT